MQLKISKSNIYLLRYIESEKNLCVCEIDGERERERERKGDACISTIPTTTVLSINNGASI